VIFSARSKEADGEVQLDFRLIEHLVEVYVLERTRRYPREKCGFTAPLFRRSLGVRVSRHRVSRGQSHALGPRHCDTPDVFVA
jgi:hypothetical protein